MWLDHRGGKWFVLFLSYWIFPELFLTFLRRDRVWTQQLNTPAGCLSGSPTLGRLSCWLTFAFRRCTRQPASQPFRQSARRQADQPALLTNCYLICAAIGAGTDFSSVSAVRCQLQTAEGLATGSLRLNRYCSLMRVRQAANTVHQIRLMEEKSEVCSGGGEVLAGVIIRVCVCVCVCALKSVYVVTSYVCKTAAVCKSTGQPAG